MIPARHPDRPLVVVGVDGSQCADDALAWAVEHAAGVDGVVLAVCAWERSPLRGRPRLARTFVDPEEDERAATTIAWTAVGRYADDAVPVTAAVLEGPAARVLTDVAQPGDTLVVGARGHRALVGVLLGSVAHGCVARARCPVVVVPDRSRRDVVITLPDTRPVRVDA